MYVLILFFNFLQLKYHASKKIESEKNLIVIISLLGFFSKKIEIRSFRNKKAYFFEKKNG
jgi:hypothetical protein